MATRLENPKALSPHIDRRDIVVPTLTHEGQAVWWICYHSVYAAIRKRSQYFQAVAMM
jgi:hypothetical protein